MPPRDRSRHLVAAVPFLMVLLALAVRLVPLLPDGLHRVGYDDGVHYAAAQEVLNGSLPYVDYAFLHPPGIIALLLPFAAIGEVIGTDLALAAARLAVICISAVNAGLVAHLLRSCGAGAQLVGGGLYAVWAAAAVAERSLYLEPLLNLGLLSSLILLSGRVSTRRSFAAGAVLGVTCSVKLWPVLLAAAITATLLLVDRPRALPWAGGMALGGAAWGIPTLAVGRMDALEQAVLTQAGRGRQLSLVERLVMFDGLQGFDRLQHALPDTVRAVLVVGVLGALLITGWLQGLHVWTALCVTAWVEVVLLAPSFYDHYTAYAVPATALLAGAASARVLQGRSARPVSVALLIGAAVLVVGSVNHVFIPVLPRQDLVEFAEAHRCVWSNDRVVVAVADVRSAEDTECPRIVDGLGAGLLLGQQERDREALRHLRTSDGALVLSDRYSGWPLSRDLRNHLLEHFEQASSSPGPVTAWTRVDEEASPVPSPSCPCCATGTSSRGCGSPRTNSGRQVARPGHRRQPGALRPCADRSSIGRELGGDGMDDGVLRRGRRSRVVCWVVRHRWVARHNPEIGGKAAVFHVCRRCGTQRNEYDPPSVSQAGGMGAVGW